MDDKVKLLGAGRPTHLTDEVIARIIPHVRINFNLSQTAKLSKIPQPRLHEWLTWGREDAYRDNDTIFAKFALLFDEQIGLSIKELLDHMKQLGTYQSISWLLERCHRDEFGMDSSDIKELRALFKEVMAHKEKRDG